VSRPTHLGGLGFGFKWNMGWMHDTLEYIGKDPIYRGYHHNQLTFSLMYAFSENFVLPISHDEVVHGKGSLWTRMPGDAWNKAAGLRALLAYMWAHPGKQLLFQGQEFGQEREWSESRSLDWQLLEEPLHAGIKSLVGDMNRAYRGMPALWTMDVTPDGFSWIDANDSAGNVLSFLRQGVDAGGNPVVMACIANFSGTPKPDYRVGLPFAGRWREVLNTDAQAYGGSGVGNLGAVEAEPYMWHGRPASAVLQLPPSGVLWLAPEPAEGSAAPTASAGTATPTASAGTAAPSTSVGTAASTASEASVDVPPAAGPGPAPAGGIGSSAEPDAWASEGTAAPGAPAVAPEPSDAWASEASSTAGSTADQDVEPPPVSESDATAPAPEAPLAASSAAQTPAVESAEAESAAAASAPAEATPAEAAGSVSGQSTAATAPGTSPANSSGSARRGAEESSSTQ
jgi:1,4-alpha-glucan branching enzyme